MLTIKKIYKDLTKPELLKKCLHWWTTIQTKVLITLFGQKPPKLTFVLDELTTLKCAMYNAILSLILDTNNAAILQAIRAEAA